MKTAISRLWLHAITLVALLHAGNALAGPPLLCDRFDTAGAPTLEWGGSRWNQPRADFDLATLAERTEALLTPATPVIVRMETLRRAAIYAARDGRALRALDARLQAGVEATRDTDDHALALFDAGYFHETLKDIQRLQGYDMPGIGRIDAAALRRQLARGDGQMRIAQALSLRPQDASLRFAAALVAKANARGQDAEAYAAQARAGINGDALLARNIALVSR